MVDPAKLVIQAELVPASSAAPQRPLPPGKPCSQCGFPYDVQSRFCPACGHPGNHRQPLAAPGDPNQATQPQSLECRNCGSQLVVMRSERSYTCPFCESNIVVELPNDRTGRSNPEFVIGFRISPEQAADTFRHWIADNHWFHPSDLARANVEDRLRGVYLPFWLFSSRAESAWHAQIGEYWYRVEHYTVSTKDGRTETRTRTVRETEWWPLQGRHHAYYSHFLVSASRGLQQAEAEAVQPYHLAACQRYQAYFLAGWACEEYSIDKEQAHQTAHEVFLRRESDAIEQFLPGDTYANLQVQTDIDPIDADLVLLPIYLLRYQYRNKTFRFLINGQTGKIIGEKPISRWRMGVAFVILMLAVLGLVVLLGRFSG